MKKSSEGKDAVALHFFSETKHNRAADNSQAFGQTKTMPTIKQHLEKLKGKNVVLVFQQATKTNRIDDGSLLYLEKHSIDGPLNEVFDDGWLLMNDSLFNLRFVVEIYEEKFVSGN